MLNALPRLAWSFSTDSTARLTAQGSPQSPLHSSGVSAVQLRERLAPGTARHLELRCGVTIAPIPEVEDWIKLTFTFTGGSLGTKLSA
jgi:hypothetical protein